MVMLRFLRYGLADLLEWVADICDRYDTRWADACNDPEDDPWTP